jgi:hypothetical protein
LANRPGRTPRTLISCECRRERLRTRRRTQPRMRGLRIAPSRVANPIDRWVDVHGRARHELIGRISERVMPYCTCWADSVMLKSSCTHRHTRTVRGTAEDNRSRAGEAVAGQRFRVSRIGTHLGEPTFRRYVVLEACAERRIAQGIGQALTQSLASARIVGEAQEATDDVLQQPRRGCLDQGAHEVGKDCAHLQSGRRRAMVSSTRRRTWWRVCDLDWWAVGALRRSARRWHRYKRGLSRPGGFSAR